MRRAVRAIIIKDEQLLVMKRDKFGHKYYTLVGGGVDFGEEPLQSLVREVKEEASMELSNPRLVFIEHPGDPYGTQYIYHCDYVSGEPQLAANSIEAVINKDGQNLYQTAWLSLKDLNDSPFLSETLKLAILEALKNGFPEQPLELHSSAEVRYTDKAK
jgi:ADP-ribose pyrophosphatase YjhB (NUDIX family)